PAGVPNGTHLLKYAMAGPAERRLVFEAAPETVTLERLLNELAPHACQIGGARDIAARLLQRETQGFPLVRLRDPLAAPEERHVERHRCRARDDVLIAGVRQRLGAPD